MYSFAGYVLHSSREYHLHWPVCMVPSSCAGGDPHKDASQLCDSFKRTLPLTSLGVRHCPGLFVECFLGFRRPTRHLK